mmetsp:Transcript_31282/g.102037  ORF Transcript_31282/g.102037 Transcript_31282/m.102037 type:complete len:259 (-) Transcript_31282:109-885(-)
MSSAFMLPAPAPSAAPPPPALPPPLSASASTRRAKVSVFEIVSKRPPLNRWSAATMPERTSALASVCAKLTSFVKHVEALAWSTFSGFLRLLTRVRVKFVEKRLATPEDEASGRRRWKSSKPRNLRSWLESMSSASTTVSHKVKSAWSRAGPAAVSSSLARSASHTECTRGCASVASLSTSAIRSRLSREKRCAGLAGSSGQSEPSSASVGHSASASASCSGVARSTGARKRSARAGAEASASRTIGAERPSRRRRTT